LGRFVVPRGHILGHSPNLPLHVKAAARKYAGLQVEASLQFSMYSSAVAMTDLAAEEGLRLRFGGLTKDEAAQAPPSLDHPGPRRQPPHFPLVSEVLQAIGTGTFRPIVGWHC